MTAQGCHQGQEESCPPKAINHQAKPHLGFFSLFHSYNESTSKRWGCLKDTTRASLLAHIFTARSLIHTTCVLQAAGRTFRRAFPTHEHTHHFYSCGTNLHPVGSNGNRQIRFHHPIAYNLSLASLVSHHLGIQSHLLTGLTSPCHGPGLSLQFHCAGQHNGTLSPPWTCHSLHICCSSAYSHLPSISKQPPPIQLCSRENFQNKTFQYIIKIRLPSSSEPLSILSLCFTKAIGNYLIYLFVDLFSSAFN